MSLLRSLLFVPGNNTRMLEKSFGLNPDAIIPDLEDSVPQKEKSVAREILSSLIPKLIKANKQVFPRVNSIESSLIEPDLEAVISPGISGISIGKVESSKDVLLISSIIDRIEKKQGITENMIQLIPWIESPKAIINAYEICMSSPRIVAVAFGAEDYSHEMEIERTVESKEIWYARNQVSISSHAAKVLTLDTPYIHFQNKNGLKKDCEISKAVGFTGKFAIHPSQIDTIHEVFGITTEQIIWATRILEQMEKSETLGIGAFGLDGKMVDAPIVKKARQILETAKTTNLSLE